MQISVTTIVILSVILFGIILFFMSYIKSPPDVATIISGLKKRTIIGSMGFKIPFLERADYLPLRLIQVDVKTKQPVPNADFINIMVDSVVNVKISKDPEMLEVAAQHFLNCDDDYIVQKAQEVLEGNLREIVGQMRTIDMVLDRKQFADKVVANAKPDLKAMGLDIISFNIQNFSDEDDAIKNLGIDNIVKISKEAQISRANSERDIAIAKANAAKEANDADVAAQTEIAKKQNELAIKKAELKAESDKQIAIAEAAKGIMAEEQRQVKEVKIGDANLAKQQKEIELQAKAVEIRERKLDAEIKKTADAEKYAIEQKAQAALFQVQRKSEAELFERAKNAEAKQIEAERDANAKKAMAEADLVKGQNEAAVIEAKGKAEAEAIKLKYLAEAEGLDKKAEAMKKYGEAATLSMQLDTIKVLFQSMPEIAKGVASSYQNVDSITMYGDQQGKLFGSVMDGTKQLSDSLAKSMGIDLKSILMGAFGAKLVSNNNPVIVEATDPKAPKPKKA